MNFFSNNILSFYSKDLIKYFSKIFGLNRALKIISSLRTPSKWYSFRVNTLRISPEQLVHDLNERGITVSYHSKIEEALLIEVEGPFEIPLSDKVIIVDKHAAESVMQGAQLYAPGIIYAKDIEVGDEVTIVDELGNPIAFGIAMMSSCDIIKKRKGLAVKIVNSKFKSISLRELPEYSLGLIYEQSIPAMLTSLILNPRSGETIVDMCASPGGKTSHIAQLMGDSGRIYAFDNSKSRIKKLIYNLNRLKIKSVKVFLSDSRYLHEDFPTLRADRVLIDPPCSALGVRPKIFESKGIKDIISCAKYQRQFFKPAVEITKPGGVIVYSTCTLTIEENELIIKYALENYPLELDEQPLWIADPGLPIFSKSNLVQRFYPDVHDTPGYFIARFIKI